VTDIQPASPIIKILSGRYTLIVQKNKDKPFIENIATGDVSEITPEQMETIMSYKFINKIDNNAQLIRHGTMKAAVRRIKKQKETES
jgi:hypothetical protein